MIDSTLILEVKPMNSTKTKLNKLQKTGKKLKIQWRRLVKPKAESRKELPKYLTIFKSTLSTLSRILSISIHRMLRSGISCKRMADLLLVMS